MGRMQADGSANALGDQAPGLRVFDDVTDAVIAYSDDGRFLYANRAALYLYDTPSLVGRHTGEFVSRHASISAYINDLRRKGQVTGELVLHRQHGETTRISFRSVADHLPGVHLSVLREVAKPAEGRHRQPPLRSSPRALMLNAIFEQSPYAVLIVDSERRFVMANAAARRFYGLSKADLTRHRIDDYVPPDVDFDPIWSSFLEQRALSGLFPIRLPNGLERTIKFRAVAAVAPGYHMATFRVAPYLLQSSRLELREPEDQRPRLSAREREIMTLVARGHDGAAIASQVVLSTQTVRTHIRNAMRKLGARNRAHATALAVRNREIDP